MKIHPNDLPCLTTAAEMRPVVDGLLVQALTCLKNEPADPNQPEDLQLLENEKLWQAGRKEDWATAEFKRIKTKFKRK